jgi:hypothetical protein
MLEMIIFRFPSFIEPPPKNSADSSSGTLTAKAEVYAFALRQSSQDLTGSEGLMFWHEQALST